MRQAIALLVLLTAPLLAQDSTVPTNFVYPDEGGRVVGTTPEPPPPVLDCPCWDASIFALLDDNCVGVLGDSCSPAPADPAFLSLSCPDGAPTIVHIGILRLATTPPVPAPSCDRVSDLHSGPLQVTGITAQQYADCNQIWFDVGHCP